MKQMEQKIQPVLEGFIQPARCKNCQQIIQDPIPTMHVCQVTPQLKVRRGAAAQLDIWSALPNQVKLIRKGGRRVA